MSRFYSPLENVRVASPCSADWDGMYGHERKRFCKECKLSVYNLSGMTRNEAERLVTNSEGRLCVRFYRRPDGTIITQDCPVGWAKLKQRTRIYATAAFSMLMTLLTGLFFVSMFRKAEPGPTMGGLVRPTPTPTATPVTDIGNYQTMGAIAYRPPKSKDDRDGFTLGRAKAMTSNRD